MNSTWLPNLVGGVSIWKLARDLNEPKFMDGRLLVPETEGSESLPTSVTWDVARLVPLKDAREKYGADVDTAITDFSAALGKVAAEFKKESSGYHQYKEAFTVPAIEADDGAHYFYDPADKKLYATNWGATPRAITGYQEFVFGWDKFGQAMAGAAALLAASKVGKADAKSAEKAGENEKKDEKKDDEKKKKDEDAKKRPLWFWVLLFVVFLGLVALVLFLLKSCEEQNAFNATDSGPDARADSALVSDAGEAGALSDASDAATDAGDASADAGPDAAKDGGQDARADAGKDGGKDAGATADEDDDDDDDLDDDSNGGGGGGGGGSGKIKVIVGGGGQKGGPHRVHVHPQATDWRITGGLNKVSRAVVRGKRFDVYLGKGNTYDGVRVEYKDKAGAWHAF